MTLRKIKLEEAFGPNPTTRGKAALRRAIEYAAHEQQKVLDRAKVLEK